MNKIVKIVSTKPTNSFHKWKSCDLWFLRYGAWQNFFSFWSIFCPFTPLTTQKIKILKKKPPGYIIILQKCTIHDNHMMYSSWGMKHDRQNFSVFWAIICPSTPLTTQKIKILKKWKNTWKYHFTQVYQKSWSYAILFLRYSTWQMQLLFFILG